jgi:Uma2 family endonuclease
MNAPTFIKVDKATFYKFVQAQPEGRYEYVRGRIMQQQTGGTLRHGRVGARFKKIIEQQLDEARWLVLEARGVDTGPTVRYPDVVVERVGAPDDSLSTLEPVLIVETLSKSSEDRDLHIKPAEYLALPSLAAYIVASQDEVGCIVWVRDAAGTFPEDGVDVVGVDRIITVPALGLQIPLREIYRGLLPGA